MSQPAVSRRCAGARTFDDALFVRRTSGIVPTPRAHAIVRAARSHLRHLQDDLLKGERFDPATSTRPIVLGLSDIAEMAFLPSILDRLRVHAPKCPVITVTARDAPLAEALEKGDVDVAAGHFPALAQRNFRQRRLSKHGFACLMRAGHPLWKSRLTVSAFLAAEHIVVRREGRSQDILERFIERRRMRRKIAIRRRAGVPPIVTDTRRLGAVRGGDIFVALTRRRRALPPFD